MRKRIPILEQLANDNQYYSLWQEKNSISNFYTKLETFF
jgi:hypothetical protein